MREFRDQRETLKVISDQLSLLLNQKYQNRESQSLVFPDA